MSRSTSAEPNTVCEYVIGPKDARVITSERFWDDDSTYEVLVFNDTIYKREASAMQLLLS